MKLRMAGIIGLIGMLTGCWPHINGKAVDYDEPDVKGIMGAMTYTEPQGDYWEDADPYGQLWLGVLNPPRLGAAREIFTDGDIGECDDSPSTDPDWFTELESLSSPDNISVVGPGLGIAGEWSDEGNYWIGDFSDFSFDTDMALLPVDTGEGVLEVPRLVTTPQPFVLTSPDFDTDEPITLEDDEFVFTWVPSRADYVLIRIVVRNADGVAQAIGCAVPDTGSFTVPDDVFDYWGNTTEASVLVGAVREGRGRVALNGGGNGFDAVHNIQGYVFGD